MKIRVIWIGKTKEGFAKEAIEKYLGLIRPLAGIEIIEIRDEKGGAEARQREGRKILRASRDFVLLHDSGREMSSVRFADFLSRRQHWDFVIGGPYGVAEEVRDGAREAVSLSRMTLTHEMVRMVLLEQAYRALTIINKRGYHH